MSTEGVVNEISINKRISYQISIGGLKRMRDAMGGIACGGSMR